MNPKQLEIMQTWGTWLNNNWLVVEPTHLKNMLVKMEILSK